MDTKHTPGPWIWGNDPEVQTDKQSVHTEDGYYICLVDHGQSQHANARLIAAAPEMAATIEAQEAEIARLTEERDALSARVAELEAELRQRKEDNKRWRHEATSRTNELITRAEAAESKVAFLTAVVEAWEEIAPPPSPDLMRNALAKRRAMKEPTNQPRKEST